MAQRPVVSVLIVNWNSGGMTAALVANLRRQRLPGCAAGEGLQFVVVDNASGPGDEGHLRALEVQPGVSLIRSRQNAGYAGGMNLAVERAEGEFVLISNPDVMAFRGSLAALVEHLRTHERCGAAGPKAYLDAQRFFQLPPTELPSLGNLLCEVGARSVKAWGRCHAQARSRRAIRQWTATAPLAVSQLSGFCVMLPTPLARELGPFDARYPFYYEDSDLCLRLARKGFRCDFVPRAEMVHFFNRSAGQAQDASWERYEVSRRLFFRRRYGLPGGLLARGLLGLGKLLPGEGHSFAEPVALGPHEAPPELEVPGSGAYLAEMSSDPGFVFAAGRLDVSRRFRIPDAVWDGLVDTTYFVRFLDRRTLAVRGVFAIEKVGGSKSIDAESASRDLVHA